MLTNKKIVVFGGTGSLGKVLIRRILSGECGQPKQVLVVSRDEAKQHFMRIEFKKLTFGSDDALYRNTEAVLQFKVGDIRDYSTVVASLRNADIAFNAAALKQVPACEYFPFEAVRTNIIGVENIVRAVREHQLPVQTIIGVSTDKACKPVNVMGMTKAIQERIYSEANLSSPNTRFACVRYGNVLASRGSVIPLFREQIAAGNNVTVTSNEMTRFLLPLNNAVDTIFAALRWANPGEIYVPKCPAAKIIDLAEVMIEGSSSEVSMVGIRPGEKLHESLVSEEESFRTVERNGYYVVLPILPELRVGEFEPCNLSGSEYDSRVDLMSKDAIRKLLQDNDLLPRDEQQHSVVPKATSGVSAAR